MRSCVAWSGAREELHYGVLMQGSEQAGAPGAQSWVDSVREIARALRGHESGLLGQGSRFIVAGATVMVVYLTTTTVLAELVGLPFQLALAIGYCFGLVVHFTLQRTFVWVHEREFALAMHHQLARYLTFAGIQYGVTAVSTGMLPKALGVPTEIVYLVTVAAVTATNFIVFRNGIFHAGRTVEEPPPPLIEVE